MAYAASDILTLTAGVGVNDTEIKEVQTPVELQGLEGNEFQRSPVFTGNFTAIVEPIEDLELSVSGQYSDGYFSDDENTPLFEANSRFTADAQASYIWSNFRFFVAVTNVFDNDEPLVLGPGATGLSAVIQDPREVLGGVEVRF